MGSCFVIQPFDNGTFDKRFEDVFAPAILDAGLQPYRVDRDPSATVLIDDIEAGIRSAEACFAEITTDNPNVWYELGFAIAAGRPIVMACTAARDRFPFDIQHRNVVRYKTDSTSDFEQAKAAITERLVAAVHRRAAMQEAASETFVAPQAGLSAQQLSALVAIAQRTGSSRDSVSVYEVREEMKNVGFTDIATTLGVRGLIRRGLVEEFDDSDFNGNEFIGYRATDVGLDWLEKNEDLLLLRKARRLPIEHPSDELDDLPF
jgi:nucleoside 2-deoxyribosyltransferase